MKLPADKKERTKILVLIGMGVIVVIVLIFQMPVIGIQPILKAKKAKKARIEQLKVDIANANKEIEQKKKDTDENIDTLQKIKNTADKYVLVPELMNYEIPAGNYIDEIARKLNLKLEPKRPLGISSETAQAFFKTFTMRIALECSYDEVVSFIKEVESGNPLISVANISISGQLPPKDIEKQMVSFDVQWPTWADPEMPAKMAQQIKDASEKAGVSAK